MVDNSVIVIACTALGAIMLLALCLLYLCKIVTCDRLCSSNDPYYPYEYQPSTSQSRQQRRVTVDTKMTEERKEERRQYILSRIGQKTIRIPPFYTTAIDCNDNDIEVAGTHLQVLNDKNLEEEVILSLNSSAISKCSNSITSLCIPDSFIGEDLEMNDQEGIDIGHDTHLRQQSSSDEEGTDHTSLCIPIAAYEEDDLEDVELGVPQNLSTDEAHLDKEDMNVQKTPCVDLKMTQRIPESLTSKGTVSKHERARTPCKRTLSPRAPRCCPICMEEFIDKDNIAWSYNEECPHIYHIECIVQWLMTDRCADGGDVCPMCRSSYLVNDPVLSNPPSTNNDGQELLQANSELEVQVDNR